MKKIMDTVRKAAVKIWPALNYENCYQEKEKTGLALFESCLGTSVIRCEGCPFYEQEGTNDQRNN